MAFSPLDGLHRDRLSNGLQVFLKPDLPAGRRVIRSALVSVQAWVRVGSVDETAAESGLSHVLEHMVFKGTASHGATEISRWVESRGGSMNAETSREYTHYYIDVPSPGVLQAIDLLGELLHQATIDKGEWAREGPVILEEIKRRNDDPEAALWDLLNEAVFSDDRLRRPVIGSPESVQSFTADAIRAFYRAHYIAPRAMVVITGDFDVDRVRAQVARAFERMPADGNPRRPFPSLPPFKAESLSRKRPVHQAYLGYAFPTPPAHHDDHEALDLVAAILTDGRCARLVDSLRERKRLVWSVSAANLTHEGPGLFALFMDCDFKKSAAAEKALQAQLRALRTTRFKDDEIRRAKNLLQTSWLQGFETYHQQASVIGSFALDGHLERLTGYLPRILSLTKAQLNAVIERYFAPPLLSRAMIDA